MAVPNRMIFDKFQTVVDPSPPSFSEIYVAIIIMDMVEYTQGGMRAR